LMFQSLASRCAVNEDDYNLLVSQGFTAPDEFFYKVPNETSLETWISGTFFQWTGTVGDGGVYGTQPRNSLLDAAGFAQSTNASSVRRLWYICKELAAHELKNVANQVSGQSGDLSRRKPSVPYVNELRAQAALRGITDRSDRDKVSNQCLVAVLENFRVISGKFRYMEFEEFTSLEEEEHLMGENPAPTNPEVKLLVGDRGQLSATSDNHADEWPKTELKQLFPNGVANFDLISETFVLKQKAHDIVQVCLRESMAQLHEVYMDAMKETPKVGFRSVSFREIRRLDAVMSKDIFKYLSRGEGSYDDGLYFYIHGDGKNNVIWKLLEAQFEDAPDRGVVGPPASLRAVGVSSPAGVKRATSDVENTAEAYAAKRRALPKPASKPPNTCSECWFPRDLHFKRAFCERRSAPSQQSQKSQAPKSTKGGGRGGGGGKSTGSGAKGGRGPNIPQYMQGHAQLEVNKKFPQGRKYCFNYHDPQNTCSSSQCTMSHRCPVYKANGEVCNGPHAQYDHKVDVHG
jgi:hypothetical protein